MKSTYLIAPDKSSITCLICGSISHNPSDVRHKYCASCNVFHIDLEACAYCDEAILPLEDRAPIMNAAMHWECGLRLVVGGINHMRGLCSCCGGTLPPDPPDMTLRQAAQAAAREFYGYERRTYACEQKAPKEVPPTDQG